MSRSPNISEDSFNALHDHQIAASRSIAELESAVWWATEVLLTADDIFRRYGPPPAPGDEVRELLECVRHFLMTVPAIDTSLHKLPLPERPPAPTTPDSGELPGVVGPNIDIHVAEDIAPAIADLSDGDSA